MAGRVGRRRRPASPPAWTGKPPPGQAPRRAGTAARPNGCWATSSSGCAPSRCWTPPAGRATSCTWRCRRSRTWSTGCSWRPKRWGFPAPFPKPARPTSKGIEINPYAAELARVSVWIGEIQWMRRNGFAGSRDPILKPLDTIECRDAVLSPEGGEPEWPAADVVVGNPPFLGEQETSEASWGTITLRPCESGVRRANWFRQAPILVCYLVRQSRAAGRRGERRARRLVATNSIRGGTNQVGVGQNPGSFEHFRRLVGRTLGGRRGGGSGVTDQLCASQCRPSCVPERGGVSPYQRRPHGGGAFDLTRARPLKRNEVRCVSGRHQARAVRRSRRASPVNGCVCLQTRMGSPIPTCSNRGSTAWT